MEHGAGVASHGEEASVIELTLAADAEERPALREAVGGRAGVAVADCDWWELQRRPGVDALVMEPWPAADFFGVGNSRDVGWVVVDAATDTRVLVYPSLVSRPHPDLRGWATIAWIAVLPNFAMPELAGGGDPAAVEAAERGARFRAGREDGLWWFIRYLDVLEAMARLNAAGAQPPIRRAGVRADGALGASSWGQMAGLLAACAAYRERASAGAYRPLGRATDQGEV